MADTKATTLFRLDDLKAWLRIPTGSTEDDATLIRIGDGVSERIERQTGRIFKQRSMTETFNGNGTRNQLLTYRPVLGVTAFTIGTVAPTLGTDYVVDAVNGWIRLKTMAFTVDVGNVSVTYQAGYADVDLPQDVVQAGLDYAKAVYDELKANSIAASTISIGPASLILKPGLPPGIKAVIDSWKDTRA